MMSEVIVVARDAREIQNDVDWKVLPLSVLWRILVLLGSM